MTSRKLALSGGGGGDGGGGGSSSTSSSSSTSRSSYSWSGNEFNMNYYYLESSFLVSVNQLDWVKIFYLFLFICTLFIVDNH